MLAWKCSVKKKLNFWRNTSTTLKIPWVYQRAVSCFVLNLQMKLKLCVTILMKAIEQYFIFYRARVWYLQAKFNKTKSLSPSLFGKKTRQSVSIWESRSSLIQMFPFTFQKHTSQCPKYVHVIPYMDCQRKPFQQTLHHPHAQLFWSSLGNLPLCWPALHLRDWDKNLTWNNYHPQCLYMSFITDIWL